MIYVIMAGEPTLQLEQMMMAATKGLDTYVIKDENHLPNLQGKKLLFVIALDSFGVNIPLLKILSALHRRGVDSLKNSVCALLIHSETDLYTKSTAAQVIFMANQMGCSFIGHPLVEATAGLKNFLTWQKTMDLSLAEISLEISRQLGERLASFTPVSFTNPKVIALHSSPRATSNTLTFWSMVRKNLAPARVQELYIKNGSVYDCFGCSFKTCLKFGQQNSCFYGGVMTEDILPAVESADALVWICPNYNDSISSNLMAVINRLTTLYRKMKFYDKAIFSVIVSGNSGSDSIARQLIDALNINKGFYLPPYFSLMEIANDAGSLAKIEGIEGKAGDFGKHVCEILTKTKQ